VVEIARTSEPLILQSSKRFDLPQVEEDEGTDWWGWLGFAAAVVVGAVGVAVAVAGGRDEGVAEVLVPDRGPDLVGESIARWNRMHPARDMMEFRLPGSTFR
jgi:hypothetical protein